MIFPAGGRARREERILMICRSCVVEKIFVMFREVTQVRHSRDVDIGQSFDILLSNGKVCSQLAEEQWLVFVIVVLVHRFGPSFD